MIEPKLLDALRCPLTQQTLNFAEKTVIERLNSVIDRGELRDHADQRVTTRFEGGLVSSGGDRLYPIRGGIPVMIADESIDLRQLDREP